MKRFFQWSSAIAFAALILYACGIVPPVYGQTVTDIVTWTRPMQRVDGSALAAAEILQFRIAWSKVPGGPYDAGSATVPGSALTFTRADRPTGRACYVGVTIDTAGLESAISNESCVEKCALGTRINPAGDCVALSPPRPPGGLIAN